MRIPATLAVVALAAALLTSPAPASDGVPVVRHGPVCLAPGCAETPPSPSGPAGFAAASVAAIWLARRRSR